MPETLTAFRIEPLTSIAEVGSVVEFQVFARYVNGKEEPNGNVRWSIHSGASGGKITATTGKLTLRKTTGTTVVRATHASGMYALATVTAAKTSGGEEPEPALGIPVTVSQLPEGAVGGGIAGSLDGYTAGSITGRLASAKANGSKLLLNMTGGAATEYLTNGRWSFAKWRARMDTYRTPAIKQAVATAVADGTILGASVMDEPFNPKWGGGLTKVIVDAMCSYAKGIFPTLPCGVTHDEDDFEPDKSYKVCDYIMSQYRWSKTRGNVAAFRDAGLALAKRDGHAVGFSLNVLHGGLPSTTCTKYITSDDPRGTLCPMTATQIREYGIALGTAGSFLNMWRYENTFFHRPDIQAAVREVASALAVLPRTALRRTEVPT